jgi:hypothetical protein
MIFNFASTYNEPFLIRESKKLRDKKILINGLLMTSRHQASVQNNS